MRRTDFTTELTQSAEKFLEKHYTQALWEASCASDVGFSRESWKMMAEMGWLGLCIPEAYGGLAFGAQERAALGVCLGRHFVLEPYASTAVLAAELISRLGTHVQKDRYLPRIASGDLTCAVAFAPPSPHNTCRSDCAAARHRGTYRLQGWKSAVLDASGADLLVVHALLDAETAALFLVDAKSPGLSARNFSAIDGRRCSDVNFNAVEVDVSRLLGEPGMVDDAITQALNHCIVHSCAEATGVMESLIGRTIEYLQNRVQFGTTLSTFQVLRHRVVDMYVHLEQVKSLTAAAARALDSDAPDADCLCAAAKVSLGRSGRFVGQQAIQLHGGIGMTDEMRIGHGLKRLSLLDSLHGNHNHHLRRFSLLSQQSVHQ